MSNILKSVVCISDSSPPHPRLIKIAKLLYPSGNHSITHLTWDRTNKNIDFNQSNISYKRLSPYGNRLLKLFYFLGFMLFIRRELSVRKPDIIIFRHWATYFMYPFLNTTKIKIIYDVCDMPNFFFIRKIEQFIIRKKHTVILGSRFFQPFYKHKCLVLENRITKSNFSRYERKLKSKKLYLTYLGKVRYLPILKNLCHSINNNTNVELHIYGDGSDLKKLINFLTKLNSNNIKVHGRYEQKNIPEIYGFSDIIWCAYPSKNFNVKYAISNKFFETIAYNVPGIFSSKTKLNEIVKSNNLGFSVDPYKKIDISKLIQTIIFDRNLIENLKENINSYSENIFWEDYKIEDIL